VNLPPGPTLAASLGAVYRGQLSRARVARLPLLVVAAFQSLGILLLLRGVVAHGSDADLSRQQAVAGATVLVVAFVALNLLAQRFGALRASGGLDYYAALPVRPVAVVLGTAAAFATFTVPGAVLTAVAGALLYQLPLTGLWVLAAVLPLAGAALAGVGAALGLLAPRQELATVAGQLGMTAVLFLDILPVRRLPVPLRALRAVIPGTYPADALADAFHRAVPWGSVALDLAVCAGVAVLALGVSTLAFRRAVAR
jgi:ABC-2 type transport system permease protein